MNSLLQDVGAYVIARTLGVVETTRASTSDIKRTDETPAESDESEMDEMQVDIVESPGVLENSWLILSKRPRV